MKTKVIRIIFLILWIITFSVIFCLSAQEGEASDGLSKGIVTKFIQIFPKTNELSEASKVELIEKINPVIRKLAHFSIYSITGIFGMAFFSTFNLKTCKKIVSVILINISYAILDEYHQSFIIARGPSIKDVGIDGMGILFGIGIVLIIILTAHLQQCKKTC